MTHLRMRVAAVLSAADPRALAAFYLRLRGWSVVHDEPVTVMLRPPSRGVGLSFEIEPDYRRPVWPTSANEPQIMAHVDIAVDDVETATQCSLDAGATLAEHQPQEGVRVLIDPAGHPFCLFADPA